MDQQEEMLAKLQSQLSKLDDQNQSITAEIKRIRIEIQKITEQNYHRNAKLKQSLPATEIAAEPPAPEPEAIAEKPPVSVPVQQTTPIQEDQTVWYENLEKYIGENLISKTGILITVIGVAIGTKYAIDHQLISPLTRIILGYVLGLGFAGLALKLKKKYHNFSAVLWSGSMAILYLITLAAFIYFNLIPRWTAFAIMAAITVITVGAAIKYDRQVIAHIGLVGAYAVPFLLDDGSGRFEIMFSYMAIINAGILTVSLFKYWKYLHFSSFILTWLIVATWYITACSDTRSVFPALGFMIAFFLIFYILFIGYKLIREQQVEVEDVLLLIANSGIFFGLGYAILNFNNCNKFDGLFTLSVAMAHAIVWIFLKYRRSKDPALLYYTGGLALTFLTIAVPVQFDGRIVTLLWAAESILFFFSGNVNGTALMKKFAVTMIFLTMVSLVHDYSFVYNTYNPGKPETRIPPLLNMNFGVSLFVITLFSIITHKIFLSKTIAENHPVFLKFLQIFVPAVLILIIYLALFMEINCVKNQLYADSGFIQIIADSGSMVCWNENIPRMGLISLFTYTLIFLTTLIFLNQRFFNSPLISISCMIGAVIIITITLSFGLILIGELRGAYLNTQASHYYQGPFLIMIRYFPVIFLLLLLFALYKTVNDNSLDFNFRREADLVIHFVILTILSNELVNWLDLAHVENSFKLGLSILFGCYAVMMIVLGILRKKKYIRITAMLLFALTLIKLFIYDLTDLDTISRTIVFLSLGILLLITAFLYNKYTKRIFEEH